MSSRSLFTGVRGRGILRSSSNRICAKFRIAPVLCNRSSYVEYGGAEPDVHKTLIIPLGCFYGPSYGVGPPDRGCGLHASTTRGARRSGGLLLADIAREQEATSVRSRSGRRPRLQPLRPPDALLPRRSGREVPRILHRGLRGADEGSTRLRAEGAGPGARDGPPLTDRADLRDACRGADLRRAGRTDEPQPADVHGVRLRGAHRKRGSRSAVGVAGEPRLLTQRPRRKILGSPTSDLRSSKKFAGRLTWSLEEPAH